MNEVVCFDIGSGGLSAARFNEQLDVREYAEIPWDLPLTAGLFLQAFYRLNAWQAAEPPAAISISSFMHSFLVTATDGSAKTSIHTWLDGAAPEGLAAIRAAVGETFHERTGCRMHPMFPVFALATTTLATGDCVISPKALLVRELTGRFVDDYGMAAASGLLNVHSAAWDGDILHAASLTAANLPDLGEPHDIVGRTAAGTPVVNASGDGFMANIGSGCETSRRIAITLGTSAAVRQMVSTAKLNAAAGTFCYRATSSRTDSFLLGCASSNGGNALDWARQEFGIPLSAAASDHNIPIFFPWLHGERSLEWNSGLRPRWHGRTAEHTPADLFRSVLEGVLFNLAHYVEVVENTSGIRANEIVLSGNGFLDSALAPVLAALVARPTLLPESSGLGTLRGTAVTAWRALGHDATPAMQRIVERAPVVTANGDDRLLSRYEQFKQLRAEARRVEQ